MNELQEILNAKFFFFLFWSQLNGTTFPSSRKTHSFALLIDFSSGKYSISIRKKTSKFLLALVAAACVNRGSDKSSIDEQTKESDS